MIAQHLTRLADAELEDFGLTARQWLLLAVLVRGFPGESPSLSEAARRYGSSRQNVKQIALGLQAGGWLRLVPDPGDVRTTRLHATQRIAVFDEATMQARTATMLADSTAGLGPEDTVVMRDLIQRWLAGLAQPPAE